MGRMRGSGRQGNTERCQAGTVGSSLETVKNKKRCRMWSLELDGLGSNISSTTHQLGDLGGVTVSLSLSSHPGNVEMMPPTSLDCILGFNETGGTVPCRFSVNYWLGLFCRVSGESGRLGRGCKSDSPEPLCFDLRNAWLLRLHPDPHLFLSLQEPVLQLRKGQEGGNRLPEVRLSALLHRSQES